MVDSTPKESPVSRCAWLFALTILLSAFLLFQVQPIISKTILPWFGGSPAVWTTCMLFFQVLLFAGYAYAHLLFRLAPRWQVIVHVTMIYAALLMLPITPDEQWKEHVGSHPTVTILLLLGTTVGLPYFLLSSTGPLVQAWFSRSFQGATPYRLYALSNAGSLAALLSYPFLVEPSMETRLQGASWSMGFTLFAICCALCALGIRHVRFRTKGQAPERTEKNEDSAAQAGPGAKACAVWLVLAAFASAMLLATTNHVCQDVAVIPFLWVAPLSLYLLSFIICFDKDAWYSPRYFALGTLISVGMISASRILLRDLPHLIFEIVIYFMALFCVCMLCHGELVRRKPQPRHLTLFYLMTSAGGALGGVLVAIICPLVFSGFFEMNLGLIAAYLMAAGIAAAAVKEDLWWQSARYKRVAASIAFVGLLFVLRAQVAGMGNAGVIATRNFYGVLRVVEESTDQPARQGRYMFHGRIAHGFQFRQPSKRRIPAMYFDEQSGLGITLRSYPRRGPMHVGIVGLGTGAIAAYGREGDRYRFYEINPEVHRLAREYFTFLSDSRADVEVVIGDGRMSMEREPPQQFDVLVLDAFSGDAVPAHLLTREAFLVYLRHLKPKGVIAANISNRHVNLVPVLSRIAEHNRLQSLQFVVDADQRRFRSASHWYVMSNNRAFLGDDLVRASALGELGQFAQIPLWTDQYNNLFRILK